jgi:hypothetical protein
MTAHEQKLNRIYAIGLAIIFVVGTLTPGRSTEATPRRVFAGGR